MKTNQKLKFLLCFLFWPIFGNAQITGIKIIANPCNSLTIDLQALGTSNSPYFSWDFGDPLSGPNNTALLTGASTLPFPTHTFTSAGVYTVCVSLQEPGSPVTTICRTLLVGFCCYGQIESNGACGPNNVPFTVITNNQVSGINWDFGDPSLGAHNFSTDINPIHTFSTTGNFSVTANVTADCGTFTVVYPISISSNTIPTFNPVPAFCVGTVAPALPAVSLEGITGTWSPAIIDNIVGGTYVFTPDPGQCASSQTLTTNILPTVTPTFNPVLPFCPGTAAPVLPNISLEGITGTWSPPIVDNNTGGTYTFTPDAGQCASSQTLSTTVSFAVTPTFNTVLPFCQGTAAPVLPNISIEGITGTWSPSIVDNMVGNTYTFTPNTGQCAATATITTSVISSQPVTATATTSSPFSSPATITISTTSAGTYLYQLDDGAITSNPVFENVDSGFHRVIVYDGTGCAAPFVLENILIVNYPNFFTPNGDGFNETWNVSELRLQKEAAIFIFDRYGKLLAQIRPGGPGWDGRYNNNDMPSSDYWFLVYYTFNNVPGEFRGHFTLKR